MKNFLFLFNFFFTLFLLSFTLFFLGCGKINILEFLSNKKTDRALFQDVQIHLKKNECEKSFSNFEKMSESFRKKKTVQLMESKAYACQCGLNFISLVSESFFTEDFEDETEDEAEEETEEEQSFFEFLTIYFKEATLDQIDSCAKAQDLLLNIEENVNLRSIDENLYFSYLSFANIGVILNYRADQDNDGEIDSSFNACSEESISNDLVLSIGDSLSYSSNGFLSVASRIDEDETEENTNESLDIINSICEDLEEIPSTLPEDSSDSDENFTCEQSGGESSFRLLILRTLINQELKINSNCITESP